MGRHLSGRDRADRRPTLARRGSRRHDPRDLRGPPVLHAGDDLVHALDRLREDVPAGGPGRRRRTRRRVHVGRQLRRLAGRQRPLPRVHAAPGAGPRQPGRSGPRDGLGRGEPRRGPDLDVDTRGSDAEPRELPLPEHRDGRRRLPPRGLRLAQGRGPPHLVLLLEERREDVEHPGADPLGGRGLLAVDRRRAPGRGRDHLVRRARPGDHRQHQLELVLLLRTCDRRRQGNALVPGRHHHRRANLQGRPG